MKTTAQLQKERTLLQQRANSERYTEATTDMADYETRMTEHRAIKAELRAKDDELIKQLDAEIGNETPQETAEMRMLTSRASAASIISAVANHRLADGAEAELQGAVGVAGDVVPWALMEKRAATTFTSGTGPASVGRFTGKAFADSIADFVGCQVVQVPSGESDYPILSTGATVGYQTDSTAITESDGAYTVEKLTPRNRYQASFAVREQDLIAFAGSGDAITEELRSATRDRLDQDLLTKTDEGLFTTKTGTVPSTPGSASTYVQYLSALFGAVDGIHAGDVSQVRLVVDKGTYAHMGAVTATGTSDSVAEKVREISQVRVTPHSSSGANYHDAVVAKMGKAPNAVMALFGGGIRILEDPYTRAQQGERRFYGVLFGDLTVLRTAAYDRHRFRVS